MKRQTAKPSDDVMRFFTPNLYVRFNSNDESEADEADSAWEFAAQEYGKHLRSIRPQLPTQVRKLAGLCLHDAELLSYDQSVEPASMQLSKKPSASPIWSALAIFSIRKDDTLDLLIYHLWDRVREHDAMVHWPFSKRALHWLYDELDLAPGRSGSYLHRILLSDGRVLEVPFVSVVIHRVPLGDRTSAERTKQIA